jgi:hypothetical protein
MEILEIRVKYGIEIVLIACISVIILAIYKIVKSKITYREKVYWTIAIIIFNILSAISFIVYHDYFLSKEKRG